MANPPLTPPPTGTTLDWRIFRDWLYRLWRWVTITLPGNLTTVEQGLTFGNDAFTYSSAVFSASATGDGTMGAGGTGASLVGLNVVLAAGNTSGFSVPFNVDTTITGWTSSVDTATAFNGTTYTIPVGGLYFIDLSLLYNTITYVAGGYGACRIARNGTQVSAGLNQVGIADTSSEYKNVHCQVLLICKAGDTITTLGNQNNNGASANTLYNGGLYNNFTIIKVG
jgi:hypothetical protein